MKKFFVIAALAFLMVACAPSTKEEYLEEYKEFIEEVSEKAKTYSETDWAEKTEEFEKFSKEWYERFKEELSLGEQMQVTAYAASFGYHKSNVDDLVNDIVDDVKEGLNEAGKEIGLMVEEIEESLNQTADDLDEMIEEATE